LTLHEVSAEMRTVLLMVMLQKRSFTRRD